MTDFWDNILAPSQPRSEQPAPVVEQNTPWWQRTITDVPAPRVPAAPESPDSAPAAPSMDRAQWTRNEKGRCPGCGSDNYGSHPEHPSARPRCFNCGYPLMQSGSGAAIQGDQAGPVAEARQLAESRTNNFNPRKIVQRMHPQQKG